MNVVGFEPTTKALRDTRSKNWATNSSNPTKYMIYYVLSDGVCPRAKFKEISIKICKKEILNKIWYRHGLNKLLFPATEIKIGISAKAKD